MEFSRTDCARARESVSAELDGELPELELEWERAHLRVCSDCAAWAERVQEATQWLREAPLEEPVAAWNALPRRRRALRISPVAGVASAAAVAASIFFGFGPQGGTLDSAGRHLSTNAQQQRFSTAPRLAQERRLVLDSLPSGAPTSAPRQTRFRAG